MSGHQLLSAPMTYEELLALVRRLEDQPLRTVTGRPFTVTIYRDSLVFIPASSGLGQSDGRKAAERFLVRYNATGSLRPGDYADITRNASYLVGILLADGHGATAADSGLQSRRPGQD
jgi:hypothetical protein